MSGMATTLMLGVIALCVMTSGSANLRRAFAIESRLAETQKSLNDAHDCADILKMSPGSQSGVYSITVGDDSRHIDVYCDMVTTGGGWTVFQRRQDGSENFYRPWNDYATGFGRMAGEFWLGNDKLAALTSTKQYRLRVDLGDWSNGVAYAEYSNIKVGDVSTNFKLTLGTFTGTADDAMTYYNGRLFSTYDRDNDAWSGASCAEALYGAWWYGQCTNANLNGRYNGTSSSGQGVWWYDWKSSWDSLRFTEMKIRPANF